MAIDLRSDTVTRPTEAMRAAIARADVGDDVFSEDPTVRTLEDRIAELTGKASALFVTSGTMGNQIAILCQTRPGDEVIIGKGAHCAFYESGAGAVLAGVQFVEASATGLFTRADVEASEKPPYYYHPRTSMVAIENTHNRAGGRIFPQEQILEIAEYARSREYALHLDGARLWNASAATGLSIRRLCEPFDSVSICFSKGLGAPAGSALCGSAELVGRARRFRKMLGGGMRQAGILAAGALYALEHHVDRISIDHENAARLAVLLRMSDACIVQPPETNIVNIDVRVPAEDVAQAAEQRGVRVAPSGPRRLRAVTHLDINAKDIEAAAAALRDAIAEASNRKVTS